MSLYRALNNKNAENRIEIEEVLKHTWLSTKSNFKESHNISLDSSKGSSKSLNFHENRNTKPPLIINNKTKQSETSNILRALLNSTAQKQTEDVNEEKYKTLNKISKA